MAAAVRWVRSESSFLIAGGRRRWKRRRFDGREKTGCGLLGGGWGQAASVDAAALVVVVVGRLRRRMKEDEMSEQK